MSDQQLPDSMQCYVVPSLPLPLLLPIECVAQVVEPPEIEKLSKGAAQWMVGHVSWNNQRVPVMNYSSLHNSKQDSKTAKLEQKLVILNPVPSAARKAFSALICNGEVKQIKVGDTVDWCPPPESADKRYVEAVMEIDGAQYIVPKLAALSVAFSYF